MPKLNPVKLKGVINNLCIFARKADRLIAVRFKRREESPDTIVYCSG